MRRYLDNFDELLIHVLYLNIRSVKSKSDALEAMLLGFETLPIVLLSETWLSADDPDLLLPCHKSYNIYRCDRFERRGGGVLIMVPKVISSHLTVQSSITDVFESIWVNLFLGENIRVRLGLCYSPPATNSETLIKHLEPILNDPIPTAIFGDFNYPDIDWEKISAPPRFGQENFLNFVLRAGLHQEVAFCTRQNNVLDLVLVNEPNLVQKIRCGPQIPSCDHVSIEG